MEQKHPLGDLMGATMQKIREMVDVNTIVGKAIATPDGITLIPISKVSFGFASGGSEHKTMHSFCLGPLGPTWTEIKKYLRCTYIAYPGKTVAAGPSDHCRTKQVGTQEAVYVS